MAYLSLDGSTRPLLLVPPYLYPTPHKRDSGKIVRIAFCGWATLAALAVVSAALRATALSGPARCGVTLAIRAVALLPVPILAVPILAVAVSVLRRPRFMALRLRVRPSVGRRNRRPDQPFDVAQE